MTVKSLKGVRMKLNNSFLLIPFFRINILSVLLLPCPSNAEENEVAALHEQARKGGYQLIDTDSLWQLYQEDIDNLVLVDTRQEWEFHA